MRARNPHPRLPRAKPRAGEERVYVPDGGTAHSVGQVLRSFWRPTALPPYRSRVARLRSSLCLRRERPAVSCYGRACDTRVSALSRVTSISKFGRGEPFVVGFTPVHAK